MSSKSPRPQGNTSVPVPIDIARRVSAVAYHKGIRRACAMLDLGPESLDNARNKGRMRRDTYDRMMANLEHAEKAS